MSELGPKDYERAAQINVLTPALPYLEASLREMEEQRLTRAFLELARGALSAEGAFYTLVEVKSYRDLARKVKHKVGVEIVGDEPQVGIATRP